MNIPRKLIQSSPANWQKQNGIRRRVAEHHNSELWSRLLVFAHGHFQSAFGYGSVWGVKNGTQIGGHIAAHFHTRHKVAGILLHMKLAPLPGNSGQSGLPCEPFMGIPP
jgi:hypothetical protein